MKKHIALFLWLFQCSVATYSQHVNFRDSFSDGNFTTNPSWSGTDSLFVVSEINGNQVLRLNAQVAGTAYLSVPSSDVEGYWEFFIELDFSPSANNVTDVYLMSDRSDLSDTVDGYALQLGENLAEDTFRLRVVTNGVKGDTVLSGVTNISRGGAYRIKVSRNKGIWTLDIGEGYSGSLVREATGFDTTHTAAQYFGLSARYTSSNRTAFTYDFQIDLPPFHVTAVTQISPDQLGVGFSEPIEVSTIQTSGFILSPGTYSPEMVTTITEDSVRLTFTSLIPGGRNELFISGISNASGETVLNDTTISFFVFDPAQPGDVIINEFMFDPPPDLEDYVELKNISCSTLNLKGWQIADNGNPRILSTADLVLFPDSFLVLTGNKDALTTHFDSMYVLELSLPNFNSTTPDEVRLFDEMGTTADSLAYDPDSWGGRDRALERVSPRIPATYRANWADSPNPKGGTPGKPNEVPPDTLGPTLAHLSVIPPHQLLAVFSEPITSASFSNPANYMFTSTGIASLEPVSDDTMVVVLSANLEDASTYTFSYRKLEDTFGNRGSGDTTFTFTETFQADSGQVFINEFMANPDDGFTEFIELVNPTDRTLDLTGWTLNDYSGHRQLFEGNGLRILPDGYVVLAPTEDLKQVFPEIQLIMLPNFPTLNNSSDAIVIRDANGIRMDSLTYTQAWGGDGVSLERRDPYAASNDSSNWTNSLTDEGSTPGFINSTFKPDSTAPEILFAKGSEWDIELVFSEFVTVKGNTQFELNGTELRLQEFGHTTGNMIRLTIPVSESEPETGERILTIFNLYDVKGNQSQISQTAVAQPVTSGKLVINEILFDPRSDPDDNLPDQTEYIEVFNAGKHTLSLEGIVLHDAPDEDGEIRRLLPTTTTFRSIAPEEYLLFYADPNAETFMESSLNAYFELNPENEYRFIRIDRSSLSLSADHDAIYLADSSGFVIDSVFFNENWHNPNLLSSDGVALERIDPLGQSNESSNWGSSTDVSGGTPAAANSIFQEPGTPPSGEGITFSTNPFSPDGDGFEDNLIISYRLDDPDYLVRVRIFDRYGREVRELADGFAAGFEGTLTWDGLTDHGTRNRVGIYIVLFEAFNSSTGGKRNFKETVVLARRF
ncbi:MAG: lamin tail domain-containing protein [Bacteroidota bacterium]